MPVPSSLFPFLRTSFTALLVVTAALSAGPARALCPEATANHFTGPGNVTCPCFIEGEEAGVTFTLPAGLFPIEVIRLGVTWGSQFGGAPTSLEQALKIYEGGLPNPGAPVWTLPGPQLTDGFINEFDLEALLATATVNSSPFTVTLEFLNDNAGNPFAPSVVHDGNGCQSGKNVVFAIPGGWFDACVLGVSGDWVIYAVYREVNCGVGVGEEHLVASAPAALFPPRPNPFRAGTSISFFVERERRVDLSIVDVGGRRVADLASRTFPPGEHAVPWDGRIDGAPAAPGVYFVVMDAGDFHRTRKVALTR
ncbi:hypothetical protein K8I85_01670 [bacterium]|nr:hypothetical protein [bacterium]